MQIGSRPIMIRTQDKIETKSETMESVKYVKENINIKMKKKQVFFLCDTVFVQLWWIFAVSLYYKLIRGFI